MSFQYVPCNTTVLEFWLNSLVLYLFSNKGGKCKYFFHCIHRWHGVYICRHIRYTYNRWHGVYVYTHMHVPYIILTYILDS